MFFNTFYLLNAFIVSLVLFGSTACEKGMPASSSLSVTSTISLFETTTNTNEPNRLVICQTHENCSSRIFSLDAYCCQSRNYCCNWFEYSTNYQPSKSTLPFKSPSILTVLIVLIVIVCLLFVSYCFSILFCFCFKCGLFRRPKIVLINSGSLPSSNTESGLTTADLITSPKHSTNSSASSSSSLSCSNSRNRIRKTKSHSQQQPNRPKRQAKSNSRSLRQSPTARVYSTNNHNRRPRDRTETELYIEYENDSPFLIPTQLVPKKSTSNRSRTSDSNRPAQNAAQPSAPLATDDFTADLLTNNHINRNINRTPSSLTSSITSSLGFGMSLMDVIAQTNAEDNFARIQTATTTNDSQRTEHTTLAPNYYMDEKPPSYDVAVSAYQSYYNQI